KEFFADRASLLCLDLGIGEKYRPTIQKYISFFNNKVRTQAFYDLELDGYTTDAIEIAMMSVLCKNNVASFEEVTRCILSEVEFENNKYLAEFAKYGLDEAFWRQCDTQFGYSDPEPILEKLVMNLFVTYTQKTVHAELPQAWQPYVTYKPGNVMAFVDNLMNSLVCGEEFDQLSEIMYRTLGADKVLRDLPVESLLDCSTFSGIDRILIEWIIGRLEAEDIDAKLNGESIQEVCQNRRKKHFGGQYKMEYCALEDAWQLLHPGLITPAEHADQIAKNYVSRDYLADRYYRLFYEAYDQIEDTEPYEKLRQLIENIYTNDYLNKLIPAWGKAYVADEANTRLTNQLDFYDEFIRPRKERTVVIISDALRYEVGQELFEKLQADEKCEAKISAMTSVLPSITSYGMAALLPHLSVKMDDDYTVLCDNEQCGNLKQREMILQKASPNSRCVQFDEIRMLKKEEMREITSGRDVIYVYHNQIDARGDKPASENEVFVACEEAVNEIMALIRRITGNGNTYHFIVTADHGFIYKRDKLQESDKISGIPNAGKRYAIVQNACNVEGTVSVPMKLYSKNVTDNRFVCVPLGSDLIKAPGSGLNYVHGGCSPQEMIVPVIEVRTEKSKVSVSNAQITLVSLVNKITNLSINLDFLQSEAVSDTVKATSYRLYFADQNGNKISNEHIYQADKRDEEATKRVFRLKFTFKNQTYDKTKKYYLIA
ncbi:MAG: BREX-1 system phosphatase PglZ type A, partial [Solobacterium sp.]|nr:BREX-1 system phosphatase PglZ type A [Solobacterium sp.]